MGLNSVTFTKTPIDGADESLIFGPLLGFTMGYSVNIGGDTHHITIGVPTNTIVNDTTCNPMSPHSHLTLTLSVPLLLGTMFETINPQNRGPYLTIGMVLEVPTTPLAVGPSHHPFEGTIGIPSAL